MFARQAQSARAFSMPELMVAITASAVLVITGWIMWEFTHRETRAAQYRSQASRTAYDVLTRVEQEVMRAETIQVPDPDYGGNSMQLMVDSGGSTVRRGFRLSGDQLVIDLKDESDSPLSAFGDLSTLTFTVLDSPTNSAVRIACTVRIGGESAEMSTVARKRN